MTADALTLTFHALADPTRRAILARLAHGELTVQELAEPLPMSQPAVSKHLKVLEEAGLVERRKDAQRRWCRLRGEPLKDATRWTIGFREYWEESHERLDALLADETARAARGRDPPTGPR